MKQMIKDLRIQNSTLKVTMRPTHGYECKDKFRYVYVYVP